VGGNTAKEQALLQALGHGVANHMIDSGGMEANASALDGQSPMPAADEARGQPRSALPAFRSTDSEVFAFTVE
jgi:hypothetical protein